MKNNKVFLMVAAIVAVLIFGALILMSGNQGGEEKKVGAGEISVLTKPHNLILGNSDAKVTIVEFLDPECEACRAMHPIVKRVLADYEGQIKLVIRYMPLHGNSKLAAVMLEEAREQGKFEEALEIIFAKQPEWGDHGNPRPELLPDLLVSVGLDRASLDPSNLMAKHGWKVDQDEADGTTLGVQLTPTFFVNGVMLREIGYGPLREAVEIALQVNGQ